MRHTRQDHKTRSLSPYYDNEMGREGKRHAQARAMLSWTPCPHPQSHLAHRVQRNVSTAREISPTTQIPRSSAFPPPHAAGSPMKGRDQYRNVRRPGPCPASWEGEASRARGNKAKERLVVGLRATYQTFGFTSWHSHVPTYNAQFHIRFSYSYTAVGQINTNATTCFHNHPLWYAQLKPLLFERAPDVISPPIRFTNQFRLN